MKGASSRDEVLDVYRGHINRGYATIASLLGSPLETRSHGAIVEAEDGTDYLDCGGYGVFFLGHRHPKVIAAVEKQLHTHPLATKGLLEPRLAEAAASISGVAPRGLDYVTLTNSGAEATELAIKLSRANGHRAVIAMTNGFHGKTMGALSVTGRERYQDPARPLLPAVSFVKFGSAEALACALRETDRACVLLEPIQGEGGVVLPPPGYLTEVSLLCRQYGAMLIADEVQSGLGRLGMWWGCDTESITPDIMLVGKALSGGVMPVGAVVATPEVFEVLNLDPLLHTSTYGGNPLASAAAVATIETIEEERLVQRARALGLELMKGLRSIVDEHSGGPIRDVRGSGLLLGLECADASTATELLGGLLARRVLTSYSLNSSSVVRLTPPAILSPGQVDRLLTSIAAAVSDLVGTAAADPNAPSH